MAIDTFGLACAFGSVAFFGTNYLPVKKYDVGDGFFFQWCLCLGIWLVGVCIDLIHPYSSAPPPFQPLAMLGGAIWCTGQLAVIPIVQTIGIAKGLIIWGEPHDTSSWEVTPGFLAKWPWAMEGCDDLIESSNRWRLMRGEEPMRPFRWKSYSIEQGSKHKREEIPANGPCGYSLG